MKKYHLFKPVLSDYFKLSGMIPYEATKFLHIREI